MTIIHSKPLLIILIIYIILSQTATATTPPPPECSSTATNGCHDNAEALKLKLIAIVSILVTSMISVCLPIFSRSVPSLQPDKDLFLLVKAFASGVILATGYMHVLPDSFENLTSECLLEKPWKRFPFTTFVAMLSAVATLMVDSYAMSYFRKYHLDGGDGDRNAVKIVEGQEVGLGGARVDGDDHDTATQLLRYRVVAQGFGRDPHTTEKLICACTRLSCFELNQGDNDVVWSY